MSLPSLVLRASLALSLVYRGYHREPLERRPDRSRVYRSYPQAVIDPLVVVHHVRTRPARRPRARVRLLAEG